MSIERVQQATSDCIRILAEAPQLASEMRDAIACIRHPYETNGLGIYRAANEIHVTCDTAAIVATYVDKYLLEYGIHVELCASLDRLHDEIVRLRQRR